MIAKAIICYLPSFLGVCCCRNPAGTATSSGIEQRVQISGMPLLKKRRTEPGDKPAVIPQNGKPNLTYRFARVMAQPMFDNVQTALEMGQIIFIKNSGLMPGQINQGKAIYFLQLLNFNLQQAYHNYEVSSSSSSSTS